MSRKYFKIVVTPVFVIVFMCLVVVTAHAADDKMVGKIILMSSVPSVTSGQTLTITVKTGSESVPVNAVQANLTYPKDKLDFVKADPMGSAYELEVENKEENGVVRLARATVKPVTGEQLVAKVTFKAKKDVQANVVAYGAGTEVIRESDHQNILPGAVSEKSKGNMAGPDKMKAPKMEQAPAPKKLSFWQRFVNFFKNLF